jgi:hypothetical protein
LLERAGRFDPSELTPGTIGDDRKGGEPTIDPHDRLGFDISMAACGMKLVGGEVQTHPPPSIQAKRHGRKQDLRSAVREHATKPTRTLSNDKSAELRQTNRANVVANADADRAPRVHALVSQSKRGPVSCLLLETREPRGSALTLAPSTGREGGKPIAEVHRRLFEDLLTDLPTPGQSWTPRVISPRSFGELPLVEGVDQIEPRPGDGERRALVRLGSEGVSNECKAVVESETRRAHVTVECFHLGSRRLEREAKRRMPRHPRHPEKATIAAAVATNPT